MSRGFKVVAKSRERSTLILLERCRQAVVLRATVGGLTFSACSPGPKTHALLLVGIGCALKEDERFRPIYEAMKAIVEEKR